MNTFLQCSHSHFTSGWSMRTLEQCCKPLLWSSCNGLRQQCPHFGSGSYPHPASPDFLACLSLKTHLGFLNQSGTGWNSQSHKMPHYDISPLLSQNIKSVTCSALSGIPKSEDYIANYNAVTFMHQGQSVLGSLSLPHAHHCIGIPHHSILF